MAEADHDISSLESTINSALEVLNEINKENELPAVLEIIRQPGWTTPAEFVFTLVMAEALARELENARRMMQGLLAGARRVSTSG
jgi:hypothetical protein